MKSVLLKKFDMSFISKSRNVLFGIATLMIVSCHVPMLRNVPHNPVLKAFVWFILEYGNMGVDIFLFFSGVGLYYSFSKNQKVGSFYRRRASRIYPELILVSVIFTIATYNKFKLKIFIARLFGVSFFLTGERFFWFFSLIILMYILYPVIYKIFEKTDIFGLIMLVGAVFAVLLLIRHNSPENFKKYEIAITRIPVFLIGAYLAKYVKRGVKLPLIPFIIFSLCLVGSFVYLQINYFDFLSDNYFIQRLLYCPVSVGIIFLLSAVIPLINENVISKTLVWFGGLSCEIYLIFDKIGYIIKQHYGEMLKGRQILFVVYLAIFIVSVVLSLLLKKYNEAVAKALTNNKKK